ncbi:MAG: type II secretion system inner membrane protein GspF, partial [Myxococcales bacterium]
ETSKGGTPSVNLSGLVSQRVSATDLAIMTRQLATLLGAGVALVEALTALQDQVDHEKLKMVVSQIKQRVNEGSQLADAMSQHPKVFSTLYVNMIRAGESSGALDIVLVRLADFTENQARLKQKVTGTLAYPAIMLLVSVVIVGILMTVVVPKVTKIFEDNKVTLPIMTRILIAVSNFMSEYWYLVVAGLIAAIVGFFKWKASKAGKPKWDRMVLKAPVFGSLVRMIAIARFSRTLSTLLKSSVPLLAAMDIVRNIVDNSVLADVIEKARDSIREGESIAAPLKRSGEFPPLVYHMIAIGERSGQLEDMLVNVATAYEGQVEVRVSAMTTLLEPIMIVFLGGVVGFIVFSILTPILQINSVVR